MIKFRYILILAFVLSISVFVYNFGTPTLFHLFLILGIIMLSLNKKLADYIGFLVFSFSIAYFFTEIIQGCFITEYSCEKFIFKFLSDNIILTLLLFFSGIAWLYLIVSFYRSINIRTWTAKSIIVERGKRGSREKFLEFMLKMPDVEPDEQDRLN